MRPHFVMVIGAIVWEREKTKTIQYGVNKLQYDNNLFNCKSLKIINNYSDFPLPITLDNELRNKVIDIQYST